MSSLRSLTCMVMLCSLGMLATLVGMSEARSAADHLMAVRTRTSQEMAKLQKGNRLVDAKVKNITFSNPKASQFYVDGNSIPDVHFNVGPSWSGLLPISDAADETRKLFFWFFPPGPEGSLDDLIFWTNGGPGCSSLEGSFQENGPFTWAPGQALPTHNANSWTNLSSVLYIEQPIGTGYTQGIPTAQNEEDIAEQLVGFMQQFLKVFSELKGKNFYITGESYAGMYVPYIANYIYEHPKALDLKLKGIWIADPVISSDLVQTQIPAVPFVQKYADVFAFDQKFMKELEETAAACNFTRYMDKYVTYPPKGLLPFPNGRNEYVSEKCDVWTKIYNQSIIINPAFNIYRIFDTYPVLWDVLGFPGSFAQAQTPIYFDRQDVKKAIHAPLNSSWSECSVFDVFPHGDSSTPPALNGVLRNVIEKSNRTVIVHGLADYVLIAEGARIALQNMTWHGKQGFQKRLERDSFHLDGVGSLGNMQSERGLTYYEVALSGHMVPQFSPLAGLQSMRYLMGFRDRP